MNKIYACIDLKSFYASVECIERNLDPLKTNLVVADESRTEKTVCLAISPSMKQHGLGGRARLYEVIRKVKEVNYHRKKENKFKEFKNKSSNDDELKKNKDLELDFVIAPPRMGHYIKYSTDIYNVYLKYLAPEDIYVYSIDEVFCDITNYLNYNHTTPRAFLTKIIHDVYKTTGITATGGLGTNMYLAKDAYNQIDEKFDAIIGIDDGIIIDNTEYVSVKDHLFDIMVGDKIPIGDKIYITRAYHIITNDGRELNVYNKIPYIIRKKS